MAPQSDEHYIKKHVWCQLKKTLILEILGLTVTTIILSEAKVLPGVIHFFYNGKRYHAGEDPSLRSG